MVFFSKYKYVHNFILYENLKKNIFIRRYFHALTDLTLMRKDV